MEDKTEWEIQVDMDDTEDYIELTDIVKTDSGDDNPELALTPLEETISHEMEFAEIQLDELSLDDSADADLFLKDTKDTLEAQADVSVNEILPMTENISSEQVETALERVIEKKFAQKIESILFEVMERVIEKEIAEIRATLQKDLDNIGKV